MPGEQKVLSTLGELGADIAAQRAASAGDHRDRRGRGGRPPGAVWLSRSWSTRLRTTRGWPTTATCATSRCASTWRPTHGLFLAEGEKVVRRAVEAGFTPRSFLMAPRWLDGLADVLADVVGALLRGLGGARRGGDRLPRASRCAGLAGAASAALAGLGPGVRPVDPGARGHCRPHQRRRHLPLRSRARLRRRPARRHGAPTRSTGARSRWAWARCSRLPWTRLDDWYDALPTLSSLGFTTVALTLAPDAQTHRVGRRRGRPGRPGPRLGGTRPLVPLGSRPPTAARPSRWPSGIDSLNVAAATAVACYVTARR